MSAITLPSRAIMFTCDGCGTSEDTEKVRFADALDVVKAEGWRAVKDGERWVHLCSDCDEVA